MTKNALGKITICSILKEISLPIKNEKNVNSYSGDIGKLN